MSQHPVSKAVLKGVLSLGLLAGGGGAAVFPASAQGTVAITAHADQFVSASNPDPNFPGPVGRNQYFMWRDNGGVPAITTNAGANDCTYYGFDKATGTSYYNEGSQAGQLRAYKLGSAPVRVDSIPSNLVKVRRFAGSPIYGSSTQPAPVTPTETGTIPSSIPQGGNSISQKGGLWKVKFKDETGAERELRMARPHVVAYGKDFSPQEWSQPQYQSGVGMWIAEDGPKKRLVDVKVGGGKITAVIVAPAQTDAELATMLKSNGIEYSQAVAH